MGFYPGGHISGRFVSEIISLLANRGLMSGGWRGGGACNWGFNMGFYEKTMTTMATNVKPYYFN